MRRGRRSQSPGQSGGWRSSGEALEQQPAVVLLGRGRGGRESSIGSPTLTSPFELAKPPGRIIRPQLGADYPPPDFPVFTRKIRFAVTKSPEIQKRLVCKDRQFLGERKAWVRFPH